MASSSDENKIIFSGQYYEAWRTYIASSFITDPDLDDLIEGGPSATEAEFLERKPNAYEQRHLNHRYRQEKGKSFIYARVTLPILNTIRRCKTVRHIIEKLDQEYRPRSSAAELLARKRFYGLRFNDGGDMEAYLRIIQDNADMLRDAGHELSERKETQQLMASLSAHYDIAVTNYHLYTLTHGSSLEMLKRMIRNRYERDLEEKKLLPKYSAYHKNDKDAEKSGVQKKPGGNFTERSNRQHPQEKTADQQNGEESSSKTTAEPAKQFKCFQCGGVGHSQTECPTRIKKEQKNPSLYEEKKAQAHAMEVHRPEKKPKDQSSGEFYFLLDSGAYRHMSSKITHLTNLTELKNPEKLACALKGAPLVGTHTGDLLIDVSNRYGTQKTLFLRDVLYVSNLEVDLLSEEQITQTEKYEIRFTHQFADIYDVDKKEIFFSALRKDGGKYVYYQPIADDRSNEKKSAVHPVRPNENSEPAPVTGDATLAETENTESITTSPQSKNGVKWLWHRRLGHASGKYLRLLTSNAEGFPQNLTFSDNDFRNCEVCIKARSTELGHSTVRRKAERRFDIVATDVLGPFITAPTGEKFVVTFLDLFTNFVTIEIIKQKSDVAGAFARFHKRAELMFPGEPLRLLRSDCAKEYLEGECRAYCDAAGIIIEHSSPYAPQLNGAAERINRTLTEKLRSILFDSDLDMKFWPKAMETAAYLINRLPSRTNPESKTPFEMWHGYKPNVKNLRTFGALAFRHILEEVRHQSVTSQRRKGNVFDAKLCPCAEKRIMLGYTQTGYVVLDPNTEKTTSSCDVRFNKNKNILTMNVPDTYSDIDQQETTEIVPDLVTPEIVPDLVTPEPNLEPVPAAITVAPDHTYARALMCSKTIRPKKLLEESVPTNYAAIPGNPYESEWRQAVFNELEAMRTNEVFTVIKKKHHMRPIDTKWVFDIKYSATGEPKAKARLVARGFCDTHGYDLAETYSPVVNNWLIRWAFSLANRGNMEMVQYDVSTAFLHADIAKPVFLTIPNGMDLQSSDKVLQLQRSLYGLKSSSKNWYNLLDETIQSIGFQKSKADRCLYFKKLQNDKIAILLVYVDDLLLLTDNPEIIEVVSTELQKNFRLKIELNPTCFVGYEIHRNKEDQRIHLSQKRYTERIIERFSMAESYPQQTPMESSLKITKPQNGSDDTEYRSMIRALSFLARNTHPDIAFAVNALSRIQNCSSVHEKNHVRRIFRYLKGTSNLGLCFTSSGCKLEAFIDASYAPDASEDNPTQDIAFGKSVSGYIIRLFGDPVLWAVKKQSIIASSSTAAELIAVHDALDDVRVARLIMEEIFGVSDPVTAFEDNTSTTTILMGGE